MSFLEFKPNSPNEVPPFYTYRIHTNDEKVTRQFPIEKTGSIDKGLLTRNEALKYDHYLAGDFDLYISDEIKTSIDTEGWAKIRSLFESELTMIEIDPFGERSVDPDKDEYHTQQIRSVNLLSEKVTELLRQEIVLKGVFKDPLNSHQVIDGQLMLKGRPPLTKQFVSMRQLAHDREKYLNDEQKALLEVCPVYAMIGYDIQKGEGKDLRTVRQEWLIMKRIRGEHPEEISYTKIGSRYGSSGFDGEKNQDLIQVFDVNGERWDDFRTALSRAGLHVTDIKTQNIFFTEENGKRHYTLIDQ